MRGRMTGVRQSIYRAIEAQNARAEMDREAERQRKAGLVPPSPAPLRVILNPAPPTLEELVEAAVRALRGGAVSWSGRSTEER